MRARNRLIALLPWLLCAFAVALLCLAAVLRVAVHEGSGATGEETFATVMEAVGFIIFPIVGAVIAARLPANPYGWLWCALGIAYGVLVLAAAVSDNSARSGWLVTAVGYLAYLALAGLLVFVFLLFPTGRPPSPRWRWLSRTTVVLGLLLALTAPLSPSLFDSDAPGPWALSGTAGRLLAGLATGGVIVMLVLILVAMASVIPRFRRAGPVERQQLKWFLLAALVNAVHLAVDLIFDLALGEGIAVTLQVLTTGLIPVAVGIAVLRHRLYEIDRIISRTVSYGLLTGGLIALYLLLVALLRPLLEPLTGSSALAVAGSTLAVAAVFNPVRRRLQAVVDHRFDRARYDAARAVDAFATRLRSEVDLDEVTAGLRDTVVATVAPTRVGIWLQVPSSTGGA